jgi:chain length determinant protein EpsF
MGLQLFFAALRARFGAFCLVAAATVLAAAAVSLALPKSYEARALLLVDATREEQSLSNVLVPPRERIGYMQTQADILTSERVARRVVRDLELAQDAALREAFAAAGGAGSIEGWLAETLRRELEVETSQSNVIQLGYASQDPEFSARVVNGFAQAYIDTMLELRVEPTRQAALWFDEQLKSLRARLEDAQERLTRYHRQEGIISADERYDVENARLADLSAQLVKAEEQAIDLRARESQARAALAGGAAERLPDVLASEAVRALKADLARGAAALEELATQYGPRHPQYLRRSAEIGELRARLVAEAGRVVAGIANARRQSEQRAAELRAALAAQRARLLEMKEGRNQLAVLTRDVETAQRTYETALQRAVVSQVESRASHTGVALLNRAVAPRKPTRPKVLLNIALALAAGTLLGAGLVVLLEMFDRRVHTRGDLLEGTGVALLGELSAWKPARGRLARPSARALPAPG